ncbi:hypothetical protein NPIL_577691 [Nephila pilipes]|uniref:Uncharacterized protein n=1 Tax=Nephila pilipes TaxID=299642 RepID=A0A8X6R2G9_NEPPI|nr:hypothetical protein NPIL_577691 [Nephila pilipes]
MIRDENDRGFNASSPPQSRAVSEAVIPAVHSHDVHSLRNEVAGQLIGGAGFDFTPQTSGDEASPMIFLFQENKKQHNADDENALDFSHVVIGLMVFHKTYLSSSWKRGHRMINGREKVINCEIQISLSF